MTFLKKLNVIEERKAFFNQKVQIAGNIINDISSIMTGIVFGIIYENKKNSINQSTKKILFDIYNEKMQLLKKSDYFEDMYYIFRTKFNIRDDLSKTTDIDFDLTELKKPVINSIDTNLLTEMKKKFHYSNSGWNYFSNGFFGFSIFKNANFRKFYLTLDLWHEDEKNKKITLDKEKLKKFNKLLKHLTDHVTNDANSEDFKNGNKFTFSVKFNLQFDDMVTDIDNIVIHYNTYTKHPNSNKIESFLKNLKKNIDFKDIIVDRSTNNSASIIIDNQEFKIKRTSFGVDMTVKDPKDQSKFEHQSDSQVKARIASFWLKVMFLTLNEDTIDIEKFNVKDFFLHVSTGKSNDLFKTLDSTNFKKQTVTNELSNIRNNLKAMAIKASNDILNTQKESEMKFDILNENIIQNYKPKILKEIIKITNLATECINAYNGIKE